MFKTEPYVSDKVWGYERWIVSTHKVGQSIVSKDVEFIGGKPVNKVIGEDYPLLIKVIQANDTLSVQVHPNDEYAKRVENTYGKTECWYILDAKPDATLVCGLNKEYTKEELHKAIKDNTLEDCLRYVPVKKGDFVFIPAGTVHAIQGGLRLLEIQEPSDITYRLYDWGRPREIHIEKGIEVTKSSAPDPIKNFSGEFKCEYFTLNKMDISGTKTLCLKEMVEGNTQEIPVGNTTPKKEETPAYNTSWVSFFVLDGNAEISSNSGEKFSVKAEDTIIIRKEEVLDIKGNVSLMLIY